MGEVLRGNSKMGDLLVGQLKIVIILQRHAEICKFILLLWISRLATPFLTPLVAMVPQATMFQTISTLVSPPWYPIYRYELSSHEKAA